MFSVLAGKGLTTVSRWGNPKQTLPQECGGYVEALAVHPGDSVSLVFTGTVVLRSGAVED